jgi:hypothetical protein
VSCAGKNDRRRSRRVSTCTSNLTARPHSLLTSVPALRTAPATLFRRTSAPGSQDAQQRPTRHNHSYGDLVVSPACCITSPAVGCFFHTQIKKRQPRRGQVSCRLHATPQPRCVSPRSWGQSPLSMPKKVCRIMQLIKVALWSSA